MCISVIGNLFISSFNFSSITQELICISTGGPATTIIWRKNNETINNQYRQTQKILDTDNSIYENILFLGEEEPIAIIGHYSCVVSNNRNNTIANFRITGESVKFTYL